MTRKEIYLLLNGTNKILGLTEIKKGMTGKEIYAISKLNRKLLAENERTATRQEDAQKALAEASKDLTEEQVKPIREKFDEDWAVIWLQQVENPIEVKIPFESAETILKNIDKADVTNALLDYLIEEPKE